MVLIPHGWPVIRETCKERRSPLPLLAIAVTPRERLLCGSMALLNARSLRPYRPSSSPWTIPVPFAPPLPPMPPPPLAPPSQPPSVLAMLQPPSLLAMLRLTTAPPLLLAAIGFLLLANVALLCWRRASRHRQQPRLEGHVTDRSSRSSRSPASTRRARVSSRGPTQPVRAVRQQRPARDVAPRRKSRRRSEERALDEVRLVHASSETEDVEEL